MPAPLGNQNARKGKVWHQAIVRALEKRSVSSRLEALDELAGKLIDACAAGDLPALKELGDRLDGKPHQSIGGEEGGAPIQFRIEAPWMLPAVGERNE